MNMTATKTSINVDYQKLKKLAYDIFVAMGIPEKDAEIASNVLNDSDLRGVDSHGLGRLKVYAKGLKLNLINKNPKINIVKDSGSAILVDADNGLGIVTAPQIMKLCIDRAKEMGACVIGTENTNHFGIAGYYSKMAAKEGLLGFCSANTVPIVAPFGGRDRMLGTNPIGISVPAGKYDDFTLDMATANVALGKIEIAIREGKKIPTDWCIGPDGKKTDDPNDFFRGGALLPMGGPKGSGLSIMVDVFSALLVGASVGQDVGYALLNEKPENIGHFMLAVDISKFRPLGEFKDDVDKYYERIKSANLAEGVDEIFLPGEIEAKMTRKRKEEGVPLNLVIAENVLELAKKLNLADKNETFEDLVS